LDKSILPLTPEFRFVNAMIDNISEGAGGGPDLKRTRRHKSTPIDPAKVDRLPPHSVEAEQGVLGCGLLSPNDCMGVCIE
jgi:hypothetical protein